MKASHSIFTIFTAIVLATVVSAAVHPTSTVALDNALRDAAKLVERNPGMKVLRVEGVSMLPFFGKDSVLLVKPVASVSLKPGMVVVYTNRFGEMVAHRITGGDASSGWVAQGYNNSSADSTRVTDANLIGAVYATLFATNTAADGGMNLAGDTLAMNTPVVLAAPAR